MIVVPYESGHMMELVAKGCMECVRVEVDETVEVLARKRALDIGASTVLHNGEVIACAGVQELWPGIGEIWSLFSLSTDEHYIQVSRIARDVVENIMGSGRIRRLQCHVRMDFYRGLRLAQFLGFTEEGIAKGFDPNGEDCYLFGMVRL